MNKLWPLILVAVACSLCAQEANAKSKESSSAAKKEYARLAREYATAQIDYSKAYQAAKTDEARKKLKYPEAKAYAARFIELARKYPGESVAADALAWVAANARNGTEFEEAIGILTTDHLESTNLADVCRSLQYSGSAKAEAALRTIWEKSPHRDVQAKACYHLGLLLKSRAESARHLKGQSNAPPHLESWLGKEQLNKLQAADPEQIFREAEKLFEEVAAKFGDVKSRRGTLADAAQGELFEMRHLAIGKAAPEIEGKDAEGKDFKLSQYRGKIVVLDFWGDW